MIIDTHAHYDDEAFDPDREVLLASMQEHGIEKLVNVCASIDGLQDTVKLIEKYPFIYGAVGVHPDDAEQMTEETLAEIRRISHMVREYMQGGMYGGIIHCFSYSREIAAEYLNMGLYLGIGGVVTFKNAKKLKEVVQYAPLSQLVLETDCPYMAPEPNRGKRNSSLYLPYVVRAIAELKQVTPEEVIEVTRENTHRLLGI